MFLTKQEIEDLTGRKHTTSQTAALNSMGIEHRVRPNGTVAVLKAHAEQVFGVTASKREKPKTSPNIDGLYA